MPARSLRAARGGGHVPHAHPGRAWLVLDADDVARGAVLFPVVGAGIGALVGVVVVGLDGELTVLLAAAAGRGRRGRS